MMLYSIKFRVDDGLKIELNRRFVESIDESIDSIGRPSTICSMSFIYIYIYIYILANVQHQITKSIASYLYK
jgi:hypothetical protein